MSAGGAEKNIIWLANKLASNVLEVFLIVLTNTENKQDQTIREAVNLIVFNNEKSFHSLPELTKLIKKEKPEILISTVINGNFVTTIARIISRSKAKHFLRMSANISFLFKSSFKNRLYTIISMLLSDKIVVLSDNNLEHIKKSRLNKVTFNKIIKKCVKIEIPFKSNQNKKRLDVSNIEILTVSRLVKEKNINFLIDQITLLNKTLNISFSIFGSGKNEDYLKNKYSNLTNVKFMGHKASSKIKYSEFNIFVFASISEGSPNSVIEALSNNVTCLIPNEIRYTLPTSLQDSPYYFNYGNSASFINAFDQSIKEYESDNFSNINNELLVINCWDKLINDEDN